MNSLSSRIGTTPRADATCAGDLLPTNCLVARAFCLLSTLRQQLLQHPANVSTNLPVARSLRLAVPHRSAPASLPTFIGGNAALVIANIPMDVA